MAALDTETALDLDQAAAFQVGEIGPPAALGVETELALQGRAVEGSPEEREPGFEAGTGCFGAETGARHAEKGLSSAEKCCAGMECGVKTTQ